MSTAPHCPGIEPSGVTGALTDCGGRLVSADTYVTFTQLSACRREGYDYRVTIVGRDSPVAIIAPHGGGIEQGTSELTAAIAGKDHSAYLFEGIRSTSNVDLHITSTNFDEPRCLRLIQDRRIVLAIHGCEDTSEVIYVGGRNSALCSRLIASLAQTGFDARPDNTVEHGGNHRANICNRGATGRGCQIEVSQGLRLTMFEGLSRSARRRTTIRFSEFVAAIRGALL